MTCECLELTLAPPPALTLTVQPAPAISLQLQTGQGPAGVGSAPQAPLSVASSRALASTDAGRVLQCAHSITLSLPAALPASFAAQLLCNASQVAAGGSVAVAAAAGVSINGAPGATWQIERAVGSTAPWLAWLQHETGTDAYTLLAIGATVTQLAGVSDVYEAGIYETGVYE